MMNILQSIKWTALIWLMGRQHITEGKQRAKRAKRHDLNGIYLPIGGGDAIIITPESTPAEIRHLKWSLFKGSIRMAGYTVQRWWHNIVNIPADVRRYRKLRDLMTRNVQPTWERAEQIASIGCYVDWDAFDGSLDNTDVDALHAQA